MTRELDAERRARQEAEAQAAQMRELLKTLANQPRWARGDTVCADCDRIDGKHDDDCRIAAALSTDTGKQILDRLAAAERAVAALDTILFPLDDRSEPEKNEMRQQLMNDLAEIVARRGWAGTTEENVEFISKAYTDMVAIIEAARDWYKANEGYRLHLRDCGECNRKDSGWGCNEGGDFVMDAQLAQERLMKAVAALGSV